LPFVQSSAVSCRDAYKATDIRNKQVKTGLSLAMAQHRQMLTDVAMADPVNNLADAIILEQHSAPVQLLNLAAHESWAATSPLVCKSLLHMGPCPIPLISESMAVGACVQACLSSSAQ
jgi:hypothetical protein